MKKLLALACATSALAFASGANADTSIVISGPIGQACAISATTAVSDQGMAATPTPGTTTTFAYSSTEFANTSGTIYQSGHVTYTPTVNTACDYTMTPANGALRAQSGSSHGATLPLSAAIAVGSIPTPVLLTSRAAVTVPVTAPKRP